MATRIALELAQSARTSARLNHLQHENVETIAARFDVALADEAREELQAMRGYGEGVLEAMAQIRQVLASVCLTCGGIYRAVPSCGGCAGLSHGFCGAQCVPPEMLT